jgi:hypothetical protein
MKRKAGASSSDASVWRSAMKDCQSVECSSSKFSLPSLASWLASLAVLTILTLPTGLSAEAAPSLLGRTVPDVSRVLASRSQSEDTAPLLLAKADPACVSKCGVQLKECMQSCVSYERSQCMRGCAPLALPQRTSCVADCQVDSSCQDTCLRGHKDCVGEC